MDPLYRPLTLAAIAVAVVSWGSAFPVLRALYTAFPAGELAVLRYLLASLVLLAVVAWKRPPAPRRADTVRLLVTGVAGIALYNLAINWGQRTVTAGPGSFIVNTSPIFSALFAVSVQGERVRPLAWVGMAVSLAGIATIAFGEGNGLTWSPGVAAMAVGALMWATYNVAHKPLLPTYGPLGVVCYAACIGTAVLLPFLPSAVACLQRASAKEIGLVIYLALGPTVLGFLAWSYAMSQAPVSRVMPFLYVVPLVALLVGWWRLGEAPHALSLVGSALIITGLVLVNRRGQSLAAGDPAKTP